jgi:hypothetical protein
MFRIYGLLFLVCLDWQGYACLSGGVGVFDGGVSEVSCGEGLGAIPSCIMWLIWSEQNCLLFEELERSLVEIKSIFVKINV